MKARPHPDLNAEQAVAQLDLAAWEFAEAEALERAAKKLRREAAARMGRVHDEIRRALQARTSPSPSPHQHA